MAWNLAIFPRFTPLYGLMLSRYRRGAGAWSMLDQSGFSSDLESKELLIRQLRALPSFW